MALSRSSEPQPVPGRSWHISSEVLKALRYRGAAGGIIPQHRSLATLRLSLADGIAALLLAAGITILWLRAVPVVCAAWGALLLFCQPALGLHGPVLIKEYQLAPHLPISVPYLPVTAGPPSPLLWWVTAGATLALIVASFAVPRRLLPVIYGLRWVGAILGTALLYFRLAPTSFPHSLPDYMADMLAVSLALMTLVPALLGLTYYIFDVGVTRKLFLTAVILIHLVLVVPLQYLVQAYLLHECSLVFMPLFYLMFGLPLDVLFVIALYGWGMSWSNRQETGRGSNGVTDGRADPAVIFRPRTARWWHRAMFLVRRLRAVWAVSVVLIASALALETVALRAMPLTASSSSLDQTSTDRSSLSLAPSPSDGGTALFAAPRHSWAGSRLLQDALLAIVALIAVYTVRHYCFTFNRMMGRQRHPYVDIDTADWPMVTVFIAAHNEEAVIAHCLEALLAVDYPPDRLQIMPVNDRSKDQTREIIDGFVSRYPQRITPFHRTEGKPGKAAALKDATELVSSEILLVFDADYIPGRGLIKQLVAPFFDPEIGAIMGRVVPLNASTNLLTRLLDLERSGGYQVDQQARMNMRLVPQYGGTVGGVRRCALESVGGWLDDTLAEDTDLTYRLLLRGWKTAYQNRSECYEEVPETWPVRARQISRWAKGHNQAMVRYTVPLLFNPLLSVRERVDGLLLLGIYVTAVLLVLGWVLSIALFFVEAHPMPGIVSLLAVTGYSSLGNLAAFFEIAAAARLDGYRGRIRLLPLNVLGFLVSLVCVSSATLSALLPGGQRRGLVWHKTERFRGRSGQ